MIFYGYALIISTLITQNIMAEILQGVLMDSLTKVCFICQQLTLQGHNFDTALHTLAFEFVLAGNDPNH